MNLIHSISVSTLSRAAAAGFLFFGGIHSARPADGGSAASSDRPAVTSVYRNDLTEIVETDIWSKSKTGRSPKEERTFLGEHTSREQLMMRLNDLPPHQFLRLKCKLLTLKSWDGNHEQWGQDTFTVLVNRGPLLLHTSFCNPGNLVVKGPDAPKTTHVQSFPEEHPLGNYQPATGADEVVDLGYQVRAGFRPPAAVYHLNLIFPHTDKTLALTFMANLQSGVNDESWGLAGVEVEAISGPVEKSEEELDALWAALSGADPVKAHRAVWQTIEGGQKAADAMGARFDVLIAEGEKQPEKAKPQSDMSLLSSRMSHIGRIINWNKHRYQVSSSYKKWHARSFLAAVNDGVWARSSADNLRPHFRLGKGQEEREWIEYQFPGARTISSADVFWHLPKPEAAPRSWEVLYLSEAGEWVPVKADDGAYATTADVLNVVTFEPVKTKAVRLSVLPSKTGSTGVFEFRVHDDNGE
jgi:hypothetical protein